MSTTATSLEELLERTTALARRDGNMDIMDRTMILHGYIELSRLDPTNAAYQQDVENAAASLFEAAHAHGL